MNPSRRHNQYNFEQAHRSAHWYPAPHPHYAPQWYPYQHYPDQPPPNHHLNPQYPRGYQSQSPLVVSSHHAQPFVPGYRQSLQTPQPVRTPLAEQSTPSTASQVVQSASTTPTSASINTPTPPIVSSKVHSADPYPFGPQIRAPFYPQLPWYSVSEESFPARPRRKPRRRRAADSLSEAPEFPSREPAHVASNNGSPTADQTAPLTLNAETTSQASVKPASTEVSPSTPRSETSASTPVPAPEVVPSARTHRRAPTIPVIPIVPSITRRGAQQVDRRLEVDDQKHPDPQVKNVSSLPNDIDDKPIQPTTAPVSTAPPKSWAELLRSKQSSTNVTTAASSLTNGKVAANGVKSSKSSSLSDALRRYDVDHQSKISFLEPRGLVNTGNMCYMNSILQVLVFCVPFFELLDRIGKRAAHNFKSNTPLIDAMILFMQEYPVIDSASSVDQLRLRLKDSELEQYGEPFIPEYVYEAIKRLPRFSSMRRGQQQDAEEFLGLLLEVLHLECLSLMGEIDTSSASSAASDVTSDRSSEVNQGADAAGWMEVQHKQRPAITRSSGTESESPITRVFGGKLRSEFRVSGNKNSVTLTPYQQLQLDIGDPNISNITDALKGLARSERVDGAFQTTRGTATSGAKQAFLETLPPVLILHLKRFHYEGNATQKIWKRIGYPLELDIPREVFSPNKRAQYAARPHGTGVPRYRLISVVYHHGKHASGGHYTVDVRRQEGREWIRLDDTTIRRVRPEDVAGEGNEEEPRLLAAALEQHKREQSSTKANLFAHPGFGSDEDTKFEEQNGIIASGRETDNEAGWNHVNGTAHTSPTAATTHKQQAMNPTFTGTGNVTPSTSGKRTPRDLRDTQSLHLTNNPSMGNKTSARDKVAYILFYQQIKP